MHPIDLFSSLEVSNAVAGHDAVINLATSIASTSRLMLPGAWRENDRLRRRVSRNLAEASIKLGVETFIQESFALIYQDNGDSWIDETSPIQPSSHTRSILDAEYAANRVTEEGGQGVA